VDRILDISGLRKKEREVGAKIFRKNEQINNGVPLVHG